MEQVVKLGKLFFVEVLGFCCMGNHFRLLVRMRPETDFSDSELKRRLAAFYETEPIFYENGQLPFQSGPGGVGFPARRVSVELDRISYEPVSKRPILANLCVGQKFQSSKYPSIPAVEISDPP